MAPYLPYRSRPLRMPPLPHFPAHPKGIRCEAGPVVGWITPCTPKATPGDQAEASRQRVSPFPPGQPETKRNVTKQSGSCAKIPSPGSCGPGDKGKQSDT
ncbi:hypothetical protein Snoj_34840 [Streptomyces nojiriensis]|uniref:Uncharacterized protein n=1 Tax=Streptomyces nojiriensis TaxID=66374 RepID=A0ABQ3SN50_9ACTN|nr:hypothetical protein GCM10010205_72580 [Streptomyces nojiriensis]GHI69566.1 hypothetical protein Snoj_34840 [Streptomyces nojiriensis]